MLDRRERKKSSNYQHFCGFSRAYATENGDSKKPVKIVLENDMTKRLFWWSQSDKDVCKQYIKTNPILPVLFSPLLHTIIQTVTRQ